MRGVRYRIPVGTGMFKYCNTSRRINCDSGSSIGAPGWISVGSADLLARSLLDSGHQSGRPDSNRGPLRPERSALPD